MQKREQKDYKLTRYACYLIAQNANLRLKLLLLHKHILQFKLENKKLVKKYSSLTEDEKRFYQRKLTRERATIHLIKQLKMQVSKILINSIILDIKDYTMEKQQMILLKKKRIKI